MKLLDITHLDEHLGSLERINKEFINVLSVNTYTNQYQQSREILKTDDYHADQQNKNHGYRVNIVPRRNQLKDPFGRESRVEDIKLSAAEIFGRLQNGQEAIVICDNTGRQIAMAFREGQEINIKYSAFFTRQYSTTLVGKKIFNDHRADAQHRGEELSYLAALLFILQTPPNERERFKVVSPAMKKHLMSCLIIHPDLQRSQLHTQRIQTRAGMEIKPRTNFINTPLKASAMLRGGASYAVYDQAIKALQAQFKHKLEMFMLSNHPNNMTDADILAHIGAKGYIDNIRYRGNVYTYYDTRGDINDLRKKREIIVRYQFNDDKNETSYWDINRNIPKYDDNSKLSHEQHLLANGGVPRMIMIKLSLNKAMIEPSAISFSF
jgi:hypothetical protein